MSGVQGIQQLRMVSCIQSANHITYYTPLLANKCFALHAMHMFSILTSQYAKKIPFVVPNPCRNFD